MKEFFEALKKYAVFHGRARRKEFWLFTLMNSLIITLIMEIGRAVLPIRVEGLIRLLYILSTLLPSFAVGVRRMHDIEKSGWYSLIPIYNLILSCVEGTHGDNCFGADPIARPQDKQATITSS